MCKLGRKILSALLALALLVGLLPFGAAPAQSAGETGDFNVTGSGSYSYADGVLTVNDGANITISMASSATTPTSDRIVVAANATATITLAGVNITAPARDAESSTLAQSAIDMGENAHLILNLKDETSNVLTGGSGGIDLGAPGIHVPSSASLVIQGSGELSVNGGNSTNTYGGSGIGGKPSTQQSGGACGTVIILATGTVTVTGGTSSPASSGGADIGGGLGTTDGDNGQGIRPVSGQENAYTVWGNLTLPCDITIPQGATVTIPEGASLTVPDGTTLTNNGTILVQGGKLTGTVSGNQPTYPSTVTVRFSQNGQTVTSVPYGSTVTITATMEKAETATNALSADTGKVDFYLGDANDTGMKMGIGTVEFEDGAYTASVDVTIGQDKGFNNAGTFKFTAVFGGYVPEGDETGDSLAPNTGSAQLSVTKADSALDLTAKKGGEETVAFTYGDTITIEGSVKGAEDSANALNLEQNTAQLYCGETPLSQAVNVVDGSFTLSYDTSGKGIPIGSQTLTVKYGGSDILNESSGTVDITLSKKPVTAQVASERITKQYNGEPDVEVPLNFAAGELVGEDAVTVSAPNAKFPDPYVGNDKEITLGDLEVGGKDAGWYEVSAPENVTGTIIMASTRLNVSVNQDGKFVYGDEIVVTFTPEAEYVPIPSNRSLSVDADNAVLYFEDEDDNEVVLARTTGGEDDVFTLTYDTKEKKLPCDDEPFMLYIKYGGSSNLQGSEGYAQITLEPAPLKNAPTISGEFVSGKTLTANYTKQDDETVTYQWNRNGEAIANANDNTYTLTTEDIDQEISVTVTASDENHTGSKTSEAVTISAPSTPSIPDKPEPPTTDWDTAKDEIADAEPGDVVTVEIEADDTEVPAEIFESIAGKDVTVEFELGDGLSWTVNGKDIPDDAALADLDLGVALDTDGIPANVVNAITGEVGTVQITLAHDGEFGFTMTLSAPLGEENAGYWANLYHYDEEAEKLNFEAAAEIDEDGNVKIPFTHASQYAIVIDDHSHATVPVSEIFIDIAPDAWYKDAVQYAYDNGLMTGVSDAEFAPEATTTRAMIVSILARLENVTSAEAAGFADVSAGDWYATAVNWAASAGVVSGTGDGNFSPNAAITREQLAAMLMNYSAWKGEDVSARADLSTYSDQPSTWATETMQWAVAEGLISGVTADQLQPQGNATRAQVAAILQRFLENAR